MPLSEFIGREVCLRARKSDALLEQLMLAFHAGDRRRIWDLTRQIADLERAIQTMVYLCRS